MAMLVVESFDARSLCKHKRKSAIWLCSGVLVCTAMLFVLVSLDPSKVSEDPRLLVTFPYKMRSNAVLEEKEYNDRRRLGGSASEERMGGVQEEVESAALEGMGILFRKGTRAMPELVVAHLSETTNAGDLRMFLRGLHRSGMPARADVVLLFPWRPLPEEFAVVIRDEEQSFRALLARFRSPSHRGGHEDSSSLGRLSVFNPGAYTRTMSVSDYGKRQESMWGRSNRGGYESSSNGNDDDGYGDVDNEELHFGAVVGFDMQELDPDDALSGFLDTPPASLRRWVCYQILIGMVRQRYRHVLLTEVAGVFILKDVLSSLKKKDSSLHLYYTGQRWNDSELPSEYTTNPETSTTATATKTAPMVRSVYGRSIWNSLQDDDKVRKVISTSVMVGGIRQIRSVVTAMATEIVRVALLRHDRVAFTLDSPILSFLVHKSSVLGKKVASHLQVHESGASIVNLLPGPPRTTPVDDFFRNSHTRFSILQGFQNGGVSEHRRKQILESLRKDICGYSQSNDVALYTDCSSSPLPPNLAVS